MCAAVRQLFTPEMFVACGSLGGWSHGRMATRSLARRVAAHLGPGWMEPNRSFE